MSTHHADDRRLRLGITSLIDVIFLLLVFFVVTASFTPGEGVLTAELPKVACVDGCDVQTPKPELHVMLTAERSAGVRIEIAGQPARPTGFGDLADQLIALRYDPASHRGIHKANDPVIINAERDVRWQHVVNAFNAAVAARYESIAFAQAND